MKKLIILSAIPGSGKSTWAKKYQSEHNYVHIISSDEIRHELTGSYTDFSRQAEVWTLFSKRIHEYANLSNDVTVILDALCDLNMLREKYVKENPEYDYFELVLIKKPIEQIQKLNKQRPEENWVPDDALNMLINKFEEPSEEVLKLFDKVQIIDYYF